MLVTLDVEHLQSWLFTLFAIFIVLWLCNRVLYCVTLEVLFSVQDALAALIYCTLWQDAFFVSSLHQANSKDQGCQLG